MTRFILDTGIAGLYLDRKRGVFERAGFDYLRPKGKRNCVMRTTVAPLP